MLKRILAALLASCMLLTCAVGCGGKESGDDTENSLSAEEDQDDEDEDNDEDEEDTTASATESPDEETTEEETEELTTEAPKELMDIKQAQPFNDGVAWVNGDGFWYIVDTNGNIVKQFDGDYVICTDFVGGYSIIDKHGYDNYVLGPRDTAIIVNTKGEIVLDVEAQGYSKVYNYDGLEDGSIIFVKNLDTFDKSGDFYYHYDLATQTETEIGQYDYDNYHYVGNGYYTHSGYNDQGGPLSEEVMVFHNFFENKTLSFREDEAVTSTLVDELGSWDVDMVGNKVFTVVNRSQLYVVDLISETCTYASLNEMNPHNEPYSILRDGSGNIPMVWFPIINGYFDAPDYDSDPFISFYNIETNEYIEQAPNCDYECTFLNYQNGYFLVTTKNENDTDFFTILDWELNPLFSPKRYAETTTLVDHYVVTDEEDGSVSIMDVTANSIIAQIPERTIATVDTANLRVWVNDAENYKECYDMTTGELLFRTEDACNILSTSSDGITAVETYYMHTATIYYITPTGEKLEILAQ